MTAGVAGCPTTMTAANASPPRPGLSLLEVLVALAILLFTLVAIGRLITTGGDRALEVQQLARATQLAQSKLAEVMAGVVPLTSASDTFPEDPDWHWSLDCQTGAANGLWTVTVRVGRDRPDGSRFETSLSQMVLDPAVRGAPGNTTQPTGQDPNSPGAPTGSGSTGGGP